LRLLAINSGAIASTTVARNVVANFVGGTWTGVMALAFTPLYIKFIGIESYALIGVYTSLRALFAVLDMGLTLTLNRDPIKAVEQAVMIMGLVLAFEWPVNLHAGGLMGLQRQILLNAVRIIAETVRSFGAIFVLWL
jgi:hypothetical protein